MIRALWLSSHPLDNSDTGESGTWQGAMARALVASGDVALAVITQGQVTRPTRRDCDSVWQWLIPTPKRSGQNGIPPCEVTDYIIKAAGDFGPDLVHVWGTEYFWGLLPTRGLLAYPALLEMQGLKSQIAKVFYGGLTLAERFRCIGIKELLRGRTMHVEQRDFARWALHEEEIIRGHRFVDVQSSWVASQIRAINPDARLFPIDRTLRQPFYDDGGWEPPACPTVFCTAAYSSPFKGLHVAVRALALLRKRIPAAHLRIAGAHQRRGVRQLGYMRWINRLIQSLGLSDDVEWLGPLNAQQILTELKNAAAVVIPTFIENCCNALQEAQAIGTPVVVSYAGGIPSLGKDEESCLFFPPGDESMCAYQLERLLTDTELCLRLSRESRRIAMVRNSRERIVQRQLEIYRQVLEGF